MKTIFKKLVVSMALLTGCVASAPLFAQKELGLVEVYVQPESRTASRIFKGDIIFYGIGGIFSIKVKPGDQTPFKDVHGAGVLKAIADMDDRPRPKVYVYVGDDVIGLLPLGDHETAKFTHTVGTFLTNTYDITVTCGEHTKVGNRDAYKIRFKVERK